MLTKELQLSKEASYNSWSNTEIEEASDNSDTETLLSNRSCKETEIVIASDMEEVKEEENVTEDVDAAISRLNSPIDTGWKFMRMQGDTDSKCKAQSIFIIKMILFTLLSLLMLTFVSSKEMEHEIRVNNTSK
tara:strand:- start:1733 stop:2131 length:399 start_codon:yes stop_codon:yes gene_type:complete